MDEPVSTAPKDGTRILALCADGITRYCWWVGCNEYEGFWMTEQECCPLTWYPDKRLPPDMPTPTTDQPKPPLWRVMMAGSEEAVPPSIPDLYAAEIRALADWLVPQEPHTIPMHTHGYEATMERWAQRQELRKLLLAEADRAEAGE